MVEDNRRKRVIVEIGRIQPARIRRKHKFNSESPVVAEIPANSHFWKVAPSRGPFKPHAAQNSGQVQGGSGAVQPAWKIKINTNDELRQKFVDQTVPQIKFLGLDLPDDTIVWNEETGQHDYTDSDWNEIFDVIKGNGPCNVDRLAARNKAWDDGAWVREGLMAHAQKKAAAKLAAE